jgi:hypothetical protein
MASKTQIDAARTRHAKTKPAFAEWLAMDAAERAMAGLPGTEAEFAKGWGISDRTLRNWKSDEAFQELISAAQERQARARTAINKLGQGETFTVELNGDEQSYSEIKARLIRDALAGAKDARDLYFKTYGRTFVEAEQAQLDSDLTDRSDTELVTELVATTGPELVAEALTGLGWACTPPAASPSEGVINHHNTEEEQ